MAESNFNGTWTLSQAEYQELKNKAATLDKLKAAGVDNWEGYGRALSDECEVCGYELNDWGDCENLGCPLYTGGRCLGCGESADEGAHGLNQGFGGCV